MKNKLHYAIFFLTIFFNTSSQAANCSSTPRDSCVEIVLKSGASIIASIVKSDSLTLKYKDCAKGGEGIFTIDKNKVTTIKAISKETESSLFSRKQQKKERSTPRDSCVEIVLKSGTSIFASIVKTDSLTLKYKDCAKGGEGVFTIDKNKVATIKAISKETESSLFNSEQQKKQRKMRTLTMVALFLLIFVVLAYLGMIYALINGSSEFFIVFFYSYLLFYLPTALILWYLYRLKKFFGYYFISCILAIPLIFFLLLILGVF